MKCPKCESTCSDLRDICPRCLVDLRPFKSELGIGVSNPEAPYAELRAKAERKGWTHDEGAPRSSLLHTLKSIFSEAQEDRGLELAPSEVDDRDDSAPQGSPQAIDDKLPQDDEIEALLNEALDDDEIAQEAAITRVEEHLLGAPPSEIEISLDLPRATDESPLTAREDSDSAAPGDQGSEAPRRDSEGELDALLEEVLAAETESESSPRTPLPRYLAETDAPPDPTDPAHLTTFGDYTREPTFESAPEEALPSPIVAPPPEVTVEPSTPPVVEHAARRDDRSESARAAGESDEGEALLHDEPYAPSRRDVSFLESESSGDPSEPPGEEGEPRNDEVAEQRDLSTIAPATEVEHEMPASGDLTENESALPLLPTDQLTARLATEEVTPTPQPAISEPFESSTEIEPLIAPQATTVSQSAVAVEPVAPPQESPPPAPRLSPPPPPIPPRSEGEMHEISRLFDGALREMILYEDDLGFELTSEQFLPDRDDQNTELLFDLAGDEIADPHARERYSNRVDVTEGRAIEATELTERLLQVEKSVAAPMPSLGALGTTRVAGTIHQSSGGESHALPPRASLKKRGAAFLIDTGIALTIALATTYLLIQITDPSIARQLGRSWEWDPPFYLQLLERLVPLCCLIMVLYPLIATCTSRRTIGMMAVGCRVGALDGRAPRMEGMIVRAIAFPLTTLLGGFLPLLFGRPAMLDYLSRTTVITHPHQ